MATGRVRRKMILLRHQTFAQRVNSRGRLQLARPLMNSNSYGVYG